MHQKTSLQFQDEWQRAIELALQTQRHTDELARERLNDAAGLRVESGVQAGGWDSFSCGDTCSCQC